MKKFKIAIFLYGCLVFGFTYTALAYLNLLEPLKIGLSSLPWWSYLLLPIIAFYVTLAVHEITHLLAFHFNGVKIKALYLTIFVFYKTKDGWKFTVNPKLWILFGGLVIPDLDKVDSDLKYKSTKNAFVMSLLAAPVATIIYMIIAFFAFFTILMFSSSPMVIAIFFVYNLVVILLSIVYIKTFGISTDTIYGDIVAHRKIKNDVWFELVQISQYQQFSVNHGEFNQFLYDKTVWMLSTQDKIRLDLFKTMLLVNVLEGINYYSQEPTEKLQSLIDSISPRFFKRDETGLIASFEFAIYYYHMGDVEKSYKIYNQIQKIKYKNIDDELYTYLVNRFEDITHIAYHEVFLNDLSNIYIDHLWLFNKVIDPYKDIEVKHKRQPFIKYESVVNMRDDELDREMI